jgi:hypothetical protein
MRAVLFCRPYLAWQRIHYSPKKIKSPWKDFSCCPASAQGRRMPGIIPAKKYFPK